VHAACCISEEVEYVVQLLEQATAGIGEVAGGALLGMPVAFTDPSVMPTHEEEAGFEAEFERLGAELEAEFERLVADGVVYSHEERLLIRHDFPGLLPGGGDAQASVGEGGDEANAAEALAEFVTTVHDPGVPNPARHMRTGPMTPADSSLWHMTAENSPTALSAPPNQADTPDPAPRGRAHP